MSKEILSRLRKERNNIRNIFKLGQKLNQSNIWLLVILEIFLNRKEIITNQ